MCRAPVPARQLFHEALPAPVGGIVNATVNATKYKIGLWPAFADQAAARDALRWERRLEFAMEGYRYFDLVRWGIAATVLNAYVNVEKTKTGMLCRSRNLWR